MREFLHLNPGLQSRIPNWIEFADFTDKELGEILDQMVRKAGLTVAGADRSLLLEQVLRRRKGRYFGNAREVRNLFERTLAQQSARLAQRDLKALSSEELSTIATTDITEDSTDGQSAAVTTENRPTALERLERLRGLAAIKREIREFAAYIEVQRARGADSAARQVGLNFVFSGNPGTGKTTVARLFGEILRDIGVLPTGHLVEADRSRLVAGYQGQTAIQTREAIEEALGGVMFIDEAYSLAGASDRNDPYGREAIDTLVKCIEDYRGKLAVVLAGYTREMEHFLSVNPGMRSRMTRVLEFPDYTDTELLEIGVDMVSLDGYRLSEQAKTELQEALRKRRDTTSAFGNAREVRALLEAAYRAQAARLAKAGDLAGRAREELDTIEPEDIRAAAARLA
jgi:AAA+ superfamily predicted ATPase